MRFKMQKWNKNRKFHVKRLSHTIIVWLNSNPNRIIYLLRLNFLAKLKHYFEVLRIFSFGNENYFIRYSTFGIIFSNYSNNRDSYFKWIFYNRNEIFNATKISTEIHKPLLVLYNIYNVLMQIPIVQEIQYK